MASAEPGVFSYKMGPLLVKWQLVGRKNKNKGWHTKGV